MTMGNETFDEDDFIHHELTKLGPKNIRAERATFMSRTSDTLGEFVKTDIDSYLDLIRRKVQQKCSTIQELMQHIRMNKMSDSSHVTPNEFRVTLIKFGVTLPQPLVDNIFRVFDTDRSGTMDFDEFATWIMNSEFRPQLVGIKHAHYDTMEEILRKKVLTASQKFPSSFQNMKNKMNFMELVAEINRFDMGLLETDVRSLFLIFDGKNTGNIDIPAVLLWARQGRMTRSQQSAAYSKTKSQKSRSSTGDLAPNLKQSIFNVCGRSTNLLSESFAHFAKGGGVRIGYDEFWRCLLAKGLSKPKESKSLFLALGGDLRLRGGINIDNLLNALPSVESINTNSGTAPSFKSPQRQLVPISRADRNLREAVRKNYKFIQKLFFNADTDGSGFLSFELMHKIINKSIMPINHEDLRHISKQLIQDANNHFSYNHLLMMYNPMKAPHILDGPFETATLAGDVVNSFVATGTASSNQLGEDTDASDSSSALITTQNKKSESRGWRQVLKYCQDADVDKVGVVLREVFMKAVKNANLESKMGASKIMDITDQFTVGNGQVDYKACYRSISTGSIDSILAAKSPSRRGSKGKSWQTSPGSASYSDINSQFFADSKSMSQSKSTGRFANATMNTPLAVSESSRVGLLNKFEPQVVGILRRCNKVLSPIWRKLRQDLKHYSEIQMKGYISTPNFVMVMASCGIDLNKKDVAVLSPAFCGERKNTGFIKFDDFMRAALVSSPEILRNM